MIAGLPRSVSPVSSSVTCIIPFRNPIKLHLKLVRLLLPLLLPLGVIWNPTCRMVRNLIPIASWKLFMGILGPFILLSVLPVSLNSSSPSLAFVLLIYKALLVLVLIAWRSHALMIVSHYISSFLWSSQQSISAISQTVLVQIHLSSSWVIRTVHRVVLYNV